MVMNIIVMWNYQRVSLLVPFVIATQCDCTLVPDLGG